MRLFQITYFSFNFLIGVATIGGCSLMYVAMPSGTHDATHLHKSFFVEIFKNWRPYD